MVLGIKDKRREECLRNHEREKELLRNQLDLLAESSKKCSYSELASLSEQMVKIYAILNNPCF